MVPDPTCKMFHFYVAKLAGTQLYVFVPPCWGKGETCALIRFAHWIISSDVTAIGKG